MALIGSSQRILFTLGLCCLGLSVLIGGGLAFGMRETMGVNLAGLQQMVVGASAFRAGAGQRLAYICRQESGLEVRLDIDDVDVRAICDDDKSCLFFAQLTSFRIRGPLVTGYMFVLSVHLAKPSSAICSEQFDPYASWSDLHDAAAKAVIEDQRERTSGHVVASVAEALAAMRRSGSSTGWHFVRGPEGVLIPCGILLTIVGLALMWLSNAKRGSVALVPGH
jgi:hypothetical protein